MSRETYVLQLKQKETNDDVYVNVKTVMYFEESKDGTTMYFPDNSSLTVNESVLEIQRLGSLHGVLQVVKK